jgi:pyridoxal phosphate-dependent aminotransferase EpsN
MGGEEEKYVQEAFDTNWIAPLGSNVNVFEKSIKSYTGVQAACALSSGTAGIHIALDLLGVGQGDVVFCSSLTFIASANPILYLGGTCPLLLSKKRLKLMKKKDNCRKL